MLLEKLKQRTDSGPPVSDDLLEISNQAIRFVVLKTLTDPENEAQISTLKEPKRSMWPAEFEY